MRCSTADSGIASRVLSARCQQREEEASPVETMFINLKLKALDRYGWHSDTVEVAMKDVKIDLDESAQHSRRGS